MGPQRAPCARGAPARGPGAAPVRPATPARAHARARGRLAASRHAFRPRRCRRGAAPTPWPRAAATKTHTLCIRPLLGPPPPPLHHPQPLSPLLGPPDAMASKRVTNAKSGKFHQLVHKRGQVEVEKVRGGGAGGRPRGPRRAAAPRGARGRSIAWRGPIRGAGVTRDPVPRPGRRARRAVGPTDLAPPPPPPPPTEGEEELRELHHAGLLPVRGRRLGCAGGPGARSRAGACARRSPGAARCSRAGAGRAPTTQLPPIAPCPPPPRPPPPPSQPCCRSSAPPPAAPCSERPPAPSGRAGARGSSTHPRPPAAAAAEAAAAAQGTARPPICGAACPARPRPRRRFLTLTAAARPMRRRGPPTLVEAPTPVISNSVLSHREGTAGRRH
jgi:hypothetical protein